MPTRLLGLILCVSVALPAAADKKIPHTTTLHRKGGKTLPQLFAAELASARKQKKQVIVMFTADWCTPCKIIKDFLAESAAVHKVMRRGRMVIIDVDEWRGPAHRLIAGANPSKLPLMVRVDHRGKRVVSCYGSDLGLLSGEAVGKNLARLIEGKLPAKPDYEADAARRRALIGEQVRRNRRRHQGKAPVSARVVAKKRTGSLVTWTLDLTIRNQTNRRLWYAIAQPGKALSETPHIDSWELVKFNEHVRASFTRYYGDPGFSLIAVAANGFVELRGWTAQSASSANTIEIWELSRFTQNGKPAQFAKKVPYELTIRAANKTRSLRSFEGQPKLLLKPKNRHSLPLKR